MEPTPEKILEEQIKKLPLAVKEALSSESITDLTRTIGGNYNLDQTAQEILEDEIVLVVIGLEPLEDLLKNFVKNAGVSKLSKEQSEEILSSITGTILNPIQDEWRTFLEKQLEDELLETQGEEALSKDTDITQTIRENSKTVSMRNLLANLK